MTSSVPDVVLPFVEEVALVDSPTPAPDIGELVGGRYVIEGTIGSGGMGTVFRARHAQTGRVVALKWLERGDAQSRERFVREAKALGRIDHPNVVGVLDFGQHTRGPFLVMENLTGYALDVLCARGPTAPEVAISVLMPALRGIAAAHAAGVVHRDLKPSNIFVCVDRHGRPVDAKVLDFGISLLRTAVGEEPLATLTRTGTMVGTPAYMAPEQIGEDAVVDERTDVYAVGVILYRLLSGRAPFESIKYEALIVEIATGEPTPLRDHAPDVPAALADLVHRAMSRHPWDRPQSIVELARALEPFAGDAKLDGRLAATEVDDTETKEIRPARDESSPRAQAPARRRRWLPAAVVAIAVAAVAWVVVTPTSTSTEPQTGPERSAAPVPPEAALEAPTATVGEPESPVATVGEPESPTAAAPPDAHAQTVGAAVADEGPRAPDDRRRARAPAPRATAAAAPAMAARTRAAPQGEGAAIAEAPARELPATMQALATEPAAAPVHRRTSSLGREDF